MAEATGGKGEAKDAGVSTAPSEEETAEEHDAAIRANLRAEADALIESAEAAIKKQKDHLAGAEKALKDAKAQRASVGDK